MNMKRYIALVAAFAAACLLHAATNTWTGAVNDWNWNEGGNYENGLPSAGDVVKIPAGPTARILGTDSTSLGVINSLERIIPISSNSVMEVVTDADHPVTLNIPVAWPVSTESDAESGYGEVVKIGANPDAVPAGIRQNAAG